MSVCLHNGLERTCVVVFPYLARSSRKSARGKYVRFNNKPRDLHRSGTLEMFLVSLLYDRICLRIDVFKINYCLNIPFIIQLLYVFDSITFVLRNTDPIQRE